MPQKNSKSATQVEPGDNGSEIKTSSVSNKNNSSDNRVMTGFGQSGKLDTDGTDSMMPAKNSKSAAMTTEFSRR